MLCMYIGNYPGLWFAPTPNIRHAKNGVGFGDFLLFKENDFYANSVHLMHGNFGPSAFRAQVMHADAIDDDERASCLCIRTDVTNDRRNASFVWSYFCFIMFSVRYLWSPMASVAVPHSLKMTDAFLHSIPSRFYRAVSRAGAFCHQSCRAPTRTPSIRTYYVIIKTSLRVMTFKMKYINSYSFVWYRYFFLHFPHSLAVLLICCVFINCFSFTHERWTIAGFPHVERIALVIEYSSMRSDCSME